MYSPPYSIKRAISYALSSAIGCAISCAASAKARSNHTFHFPPYDTSANAQQRTTRYARAVLITQRHRNFAISCTRIESSRFFKYLSVKIS